MFQGKKANMGMTLFLGVLIFNIIMYFLIWGANADADYNTLGSGGGFEGRLNATTDQDISTTSVTNWYSGFNVAVFDLPWWVNIFYVTLQAILLSLAIYAMVRGLS